MFAVLFVAAAALPPAPREALLDDAPTQVAIARARPQGEPLRGVAEYFASLAAFTLVNAGGSAMLSNGHVTVSKGGNVSLDGSQASLAAAGTCFVLSPLAAALTSWLVGKGSDSWDPSLGWTTLGAYGTSLAAVGAGLGLAAMNVDRGAAVAANTAFYLAIPLGTVLVQNATKSPNQ
ncbi:MAG: hypothetical protein ABR567_03325 [Myxococcales bacterium]|nr:hypothetical protein [Myxococcales bacterium]